MSAAEDRFMWLFVFFDLPVLSKEERRAAVRFRNFLLNDGYMMMQLSVYARVCNGQERVEKHVKRLEHAIPAKGSVRVIQITDRQYERMKILIGKRNAREEKKVEQLLLF